MLIYCVHWPTNRVREFSSFSIKLAREDHVINMEFK